MTTEEASPTVDVVAETIALRTPDAHKTANLKRALVQLLLACDTTPDLLSDLIPGTDYEVQGYYNMVPQPTRPSYNMQLDNWVAESELPIFVRRLKDLAHRLGCMPGAVKKFADDSYYGVELYLEGAVRIRVFTGRSQVCTQVATGEVRTFTRKKIVTPAVTIDEIVSEDVMEWVCPDTILEVD